MAKSGVYYKYKLFCITQYFLICHDFLKHFNPCKYIQNRSHFLIRSACISTYPKTLKNAIGNFSYLSSFPVSRKGSWKGDKERKAKRDRLSTLDYLEISIWFKCPKLQPMRMRPKLSRIHALEFNKYRLIIGYLNLNSICCLDKPNLHKKGSIWKYSKH